MTRNIFDIKEKIFSISSEEEFQDLANQIFRHQYDNILVYKSFVDALKINPLDVNSINKIPFLPIQFFKSHQINNKSRDVEIVFSSSGTTGAETSKHYVSDLKLYKQSFIKSFEQYYGSVSDYVILALLPSYLEREGSSLIYMTEHLIKLSDNSESGFYLHNHQELVEKIERLKQSPTRILLIGVTYALLDLAEKFKLDWSNVVVMETGGMKGKRQEIVREELHQILQNAFNVRKIHSEYGMTELLSQAYSKGDGVFSTPPWMKVVIRETGDPFSLLGNNVSGGINIIDLANINSCSFIATQDLGKKISNTQFEVLGRFDNSDLRGCNLLV